jgi:hypothetical protein
VTAVDVDNWLPLDGLEPGFDEYKLPTSDQLAGQRLHVRHSDGQRSVYDLRPDGTATWDTASTNGEAARGSGAYEAIEVAPRLLFVDMFASRGAAISPTLIVDAASGSVATAVTALGPAGAAQTGKASVVQTFSAGSTTNEGSVPLGERTRDLVGSRLLYRYSGQHAYEHVYLNDDWFSWHCLAGPEVGQADTDSCSTYRLGESLYLFAWREKVIPCASVVLVNLNEMRSTGKLFGWAQDGVTPVNFTFGAHIDRLGRATYPPELDPSARP